MLDGCRLEYTQPELRTHPRFDDLEDGRVLSEELLDVLPPLPEPLTAEGEPCTALLDDLAIDR